MNSMEVEIKRLCPMGFMVSQAIHNDMGCLVFFFAVQHMSYVSNPICYMHLEIEVSSS